MAISNFVFILCLVYRLFDNLSIIANLHSAICAFVQEVSNSVSSSSTTVISLNSFLFNAFTTNSFCSYILTQL